MKKTILFTIVFLFTFPKMICSGTIEEYLEELKIIDPSIRKTVEINKREGSKNNTPQSENDRTQSEEKIILENTNNVYVLKTLKAIKEELDYQKKIRGKAKFAFKGDDIQSRTNSGDIKSDQYSFDVGIEVNRGTYPGEFLFSSDIGLRLSEGDIEEDITKFETKYDYYSKEWMENFVFASRFSDQFMNIDQRYEIGFGIFWGMTFGTIENKNKPYSVIFDENAKEKERYKKDKEIRDKIKIMLDYKDRADLEEKDFYNNNEIFAWYSNYKTINPDGKIQLRTFLDDLDKIVRDVEIAQKKRNGKFRLGVCTSLITEIETASFKIEEDKTTLPSTQNYRINLRPTFEFQPSNRWKYKLHWYWKLPLGKSKGYRIRENGDTEEALDYRSDLDTSLSYSVKSSEIGQAGDIDITLRYRRFYDNVPPIYGDYFVPSETISAPDTHHLITLELGINW